MPLIQRNTLSLNNVVYTTGNYINPPWIISLSPHKVGNTIAYWNANRIQGYSVSTGIPASGQALVFSGSQWVPSGISTGGGSTSGIFISGFTILDGTSSGTLVDTSVAAIDSYPIASGDTIKYITKSSYGSDLQASEIILISDGTDVFMSEYGLVYSNNKLVTFSADISGSDIVLYGQAVNANTSIKLFKMAIN